jgi:16S rRNA (cytosine1402-N4)-methyltransferase
MLHEVLAALQPAPGKTVIDGTFGAGGYSRAFLAAGARVVAFDRDPTARRFAEGLDGGFRLVEARFSEMAGIVEAAQGVALDIGVSSMQLDEPERGFSFLRDGPLDMRMGGEGPTAADLVNAAPAEELARVLYVYGEERQSRRIAAAIVRRRTEQPFSRTVELAEFIEKALGGRRGAKVHPATRSFQGLRIAVNEELAELEAGLAAAERVLTPGRPAGGGHLPLTGRPHREGLPGRARRQDGGRLPPPAASGREGPAQLPPAVQRGRGAQRGGSRRQPPRPLRQAARRRTYRRSGLEGGGMTLLRQGFGGQALVIRVIRRSSDRSVVG